ncbi:MAG: hypothetical protein U0Q16_13490 [Bryobacteraceae bacterium]
MTRNILALVLVAALAAPAPAQTGEILLVVKEGDGAVHNIRRKAVSPVMVEVRDARNRPVAEAKVRFTLPEIGPGGRFIDGSRTLETFTDAEGHAGFSSFVINEQEGRFSIAVEAIAHGREANTAISQSSSLFLPPKAGVESAIDSKPRRSRSLALILGLGAAATAAGVLATRGGGSATSPPVAVGVGGVAVGGPR